MASSPAAPAIFCNSCGASNAPTNLGCLRCGRPFPETQPNVSSALKSPTGFGGWLLLFCFTTCFATPVSFARIYLRSPFQLHWLMFVTAVPMLLGIVAGGLLATERSQAIIVLRLFFLSLAAKGAIWMAVAFVEPGPKGPYLTVAMRTMLFTVIWALYFQNSARVRNTYGKNL